MKTEEQFANRLQTAMSSPEHDYLDLMHDILEGGVVKQDRTGVGTRSIFGAQLRFPLAAGFPLLTTKRLHLRSIIYELLWFLRGDTNIAYLNEHGVRIWDEWADEHGDLGPVYGKQWRNWGGVSGVITTNEELTEDTITVLRDFARGSRQRFLVVPHDAKVSVQPGIDQLANVVERIKTNPDCRRLIVSAWNVADIPDMALAPCHVSFQFYVAEGKLSCHMYQRSADLFLGVPFNIASYALLTQMTAAVVGLELGDLIISFGDVHIYLNHIEQCTEQLDREPRPLPTMHLKRVPESLFDFKYEDFDLRDYNPHPSIKAPVAV